MKTSLGGTKSRVILQNSDDERFFSDSGLVKQSNIRLILSSGVDVDRFSRGGDRQAGERFTVLLAARLLWDKGIAEYVEASRLLRDQGRSIRFLLAGTPDPGNPASVTIGDLQQWVDSGLIEWLSHVDNMPELLANTHAAVLPTTYGEGVPRSLTEAAACGIPIITTDTPGCREVVSDGEQGLLIPPRDAAALARAIALLEDDQELAQRMGKAARVRACEKFDERVVIEQTLAVYEELLFTGNDVSVA